MGTLLDLKREGKIRAIGASNATLADIREYLKAGPLDGDQEKYSMLDREEEAEKLGFLSEHHIAFLAYSPLARGLLTGKVGPDRMFPEGDQRRDSSRFSIEARKKVAAMLGQLEPLARERGLTLTQLVIAWTLAQPGVTHVLVGARNPRQALENARAGEVELTPAEIERINSAIDQHAEALVRR
jgi:methylglyoxal reductase